MVVVRAATVADLPRFEQCAREFYAASKHLRNFDIGRFCEAWGQWMTSGIGVIFMAESADEPVGAIGGIVYPEIYSGELIGTEFFWFVRPGHRGAGMRLYREFEAWARAKGCTQIRMVHLADSMSEKLHRLYVALGFEQTETHYAKEIHP